MSTIKKVRFGSERNAWLRLCGVFLLIAGSIAAWRTWSLDKSTAIFSCSFCVMGLILVARRDFVEIDPAKGILSRKRGIVFAVATHSISITDVRKVELRAYRRGKSKANQDETKVFGLFIVPTHKGAIAEFGDQWEARRIGEKMSAMLGVPFDNCVHDAHSARAADQLDVPLLEHWHRSKMYDGERPVLPTTSTLRIHESPKQTCISYPITTSTSVVFAMVAVALGMGLILVYLYLPTQGKWIWLTFLSILFVIASMAALGFNGRSKIYITSKCVRFAQGSLPAMREISLMSIEEMIMSKDGIHLVGDSGAVHIDWPAPRTDAEFLKQCLPYELSRRAKC